MYNKRIYADGVDVTERVSRADKLDIRILEVKYTLDEDDISRCKVKYNIVNYDKFEEYYFKTIRYYSIEELKDIIEDYIMKQFIQDNYSKIMLVYKYKRYMDGVEERNRSIEELKNSKDMIELSKTLRNITTL